MTPAARISAAIDVLDQILLGQSAEFVLTNWGRANRFAGSGDRAAIRDLVYDALRCRASFAAYGGGLTGRGLALGGLRALGGDIDALFTGEGHAPAKVTAQDEGQVPSGFDALDCPPWLGPKLQASLGAELEPILQALQRRAPVFLRVNLARITREDARIVLAEDAIETQPVSWVHTGLEVTENARKIQSSKAYQTGLVELQDASSQAVVASLYLTPNMKVLDYCAGGGGKALALAARGAKVWAHDAFAARMADLPTRAARAGQRILITAQPAETKPYDIVLTDVPCSGSGSWRRDPVGKWALTPARLAELCALQAQIMDMSAPLVRHGGTLAYVTCSLLTEENEAQVAAFLARHTGWLVKTQKRFSPIEGGDGFFLATLTRV